MTTNSIHEPSISIEKMLNFFNGHLRHFHLKAVALRALKLVLAALTVAWLTQTTGRAQTTNYWDNTSPIEADGFGAAGGIWGTDAKWSPDATGNSTAGIVIPASTNYLYFGTDQPGYGLGAGTVSIGGTVSAVATYVGSQSGAVTLGSGPGSSTISITANLIGTNFVNAFLNNSTNLLTIDANLDFGTTGSRRLFGAAGPITVNGSITGSGSGARFFNSGCNLTLKGNVSEQMMLNGGKTIVGSAGLTWGAISTEAATGGTGGTLDLNGNDLTIGKLGGGPLSTTITDNAAGSGTSTLTVTVGGTATSGVAVGVTIADGATRKVGLTCKVPSGSYLVLTNANTYSGGTTIIGPGTLALNATGSINNSTNISIGAGSAVFDVSAITNYTLSTNTSLSASGYGTSLGTKAVLKGGTNVNLGSQPIVLTWGGNTSGTDNVHPCLWITQSALTLNNNPFTINGATTLGGGIYRLIQVTNGTAGVINESASPSYAVTGTAIDSARTNVISVSGGNVILTVSTPTTTTVSREVGSSPSTYGSPLTFKAAVVPVGGPTVPSGTVQFKTNGVAFGSAVTVVTDVSPNGKAEINASSLPASGSAYTVTAVYTPANTNFLASSDSTGIAQIINAVTSTATLAATVASNTATITVSGGPNTTYTLQTATNLTGSWWPIATNTANSGGVLIFVDPNATNAQQFYRTAH